MGPFTILAQTAPTTIGGQNRKNRDKVAGVGVASPTPSCHLPPRPPASVARLPSPGVQRGAPATLPSPPQPPGRRLQPARAPAQPRRRRPARARFDVRYTCQWEPLEKLTNGESEEAIAAFEQATGRSLPRPAPPPPGPAAAPGPPPPFRPSPRQALLLMLPVRRPGTWACRWWGGRCSTGGPTVARLARSPGDPPADRHVSHGEPGPGLSEPGAGACVRGRPRPAAPSPPALTLGLVGGPAGSPPGRAEQRHWYDSESRLGVEVKIHLYLF